MALRYSPNPQAADIAGTCAYIDRMSLLPWLSLGEPLQQDIARALDQLRQRFSR